MADLPATFRSGRGQAASTFDRGCGFAPAGVVLDYCVECADESPALLLRATALANIALKYWFTIHDDSGQNAGPVRVMLSSCPSCTIDFVATLSVRDPAPWPTR